MPVPVAAPVDASARAERFAFASAGIDRRSEWRDDAARLDTFWNEATTRVVVLRRDGKAMCRPELGALAPVSPALTAGARADANYLGERDGVAWFALSLPDDAADALAETQQARFLDLRAAAGQLGAIDAGLAAYARALAHWQSRKRYCGRCGAPTLFGNAGHRAQCSDATCGQEYFPRTDPAIIVIVTDGSRCLLGNQAAWGAKRFSTLAGFVEPGESLEHAVAREVAEESGVRVSGCRYVTSQPWPFPASLMLGFEAQALTHEITVGDELSDARWFDAATMAEQVEAGELVLSPEISIAFHLINGWYARVTGGALAPGPLMHPRR